MTKLSLYFFFSFALFLFLTLSKEAYASILYLIPNSKTLSAGDTVPVLIKLNTQGEEINAVSAHIAYPIDLLDVVSIAPSSVFPIVAEQTTNNGVIKITRGSIAQVTGDIDVATVTFVAKSAGSSAAILTFQQGSAAPRFSNSTDSLDLSRSIGSIFTINQSNSAQTLGTESAQITSAPPVVPATNSGINNTMVVTSKTLSIESIVSFVVHLFSF